jgi:uncharacterized membrane protein YqjE
MEEAPDSLGRIATSSRRVAQDFLTIGENRLELLLVELEEERDHLLRVFLLALGVAVFGLLAGMTMTAAIVVWWWAYSPVAVLLALTGLHALFGICLYWRFSRHLREWQSFSATLDQLRKDRACIGKLLS